MIHALLKQLPFNSLVLYSNAMNGLSPLAQWRERLQALGLAGLWDELMRPGSPPAFLAAQGLRVAQPVLGAFASQAALARLGALADRLEAQSDPESQA